MKEKHYLNNEIGICVFFSGKINRNNTNAIVDVSIFNHDCDDIKVSLNYLDSRGDYGQVLDKALQKFVKDSWFISKESFIIKNYFLKKFIYQMKKIFPIFVLEKDLVKILKIAKKERNTGINPYEREYRFLPVDNFDIDNPVFVLTDDKSDVSSLKK